MEYRYKLSEYIHGICTKCGYGCNSVGETIKYLQLLCTFVQYFE